MVRLGRRPGLHRRHAAAVPCTSRSAAVTPCSIRTDLDPDPELTEYVWEFYEYAAADFERTNTFADPHTAELRNTHKLTSSPLLSLNPLHEPVET